MCRNWRSGCDSRRSTDYRRRTNWRTWRGFGNGCIRRCGGSCRGGIPSIGGRSGRLAAGEDQEFAEVVGVHYSLLQRGEGLVANDLFGERRLERSFEQLIQVLVRDV